MHISTPVMCNNVGSEPYVAAGNCYNQLQYNRRIYLYSLWGYLYNKNLFGAQCIIFRLGIIGMMKRILGSMIRIIRRYT